MNILLSTHASIERNVSTWAYDSDTVALNQFGADEVFEPGGRRRRPVHAVGFSSRLHSEVHIAPARLEKIG